ncbi:MAG: hypothetical protein ABFS32_17660 [Bacteroidota bacterium]
MRLLITIFFAGLLVIDAIGQSSNAPLNKEYYHLLDRLEIRGGNMAPGYHSAVKPYSRKAIAALIDSTRNHENLNSGVDKFNNTYLANDNWKWTQNHDNINTRPIWNTVYKYRSDFLYGEDKNEAVAIHVNPVLYFSAGGETAGDQYTFINTRGIQVHGMVDGKVGYYTFIGENQMRAPLYVRDWVGKYGVVPNEGFWKGFGEGSYDFFTATGYISFNATKHINFQFGHDRQFWGDGYRSVILSDFSPPALFLKINTNVWRLNYTNLFTQVIGDTYGQPGGSLGNMKYPKKYMIAHRLSFNLGKNINLGVVESIVFSRLDSLGNSHFELSYLNPIIFYRSIEHQGGSLDNALIGIDAKWNFLQHFSFYGQLFYDEIKVKEFFTNPGWWGNKFSYQLGLKYIDAFKVSNLDLQLEHNFVRPYTYSHGSAYNQGFIFSNYANYKQPLAHPLGANFKEWIGIVRYQPIPKLSLTGKVIMANYGLDEPGTNYGKEILKDYTTKVSEEGNFTGQGIATDLLFADFSASYMIWHNTFFDARVIYRNQDSADDQYNQNSTIYSVSFRWNIAPRVQEF